MHLLLMIGLVVFSILSVLIRDLLKAAISLAVASIFLAIIFFRMNLFDKFSDICVIMCIERSSIKFITFKT